jgi:hypothetical protein
LPSESLWNIYEELAEKGGEILIMVLLNSIWRRFFYLFRRCELFEKMFFSGFFSVYFLFGYSVELSGKLNSFTFSLKQIFFKFHYVFKEHSIICLFFSVFFISFFQKFGIFDHLELDVRNYSRLLITTWKLLFLRKCSHFIVIIYFITIPMKNS